MSGPKEPDQGNTGLGQKKTKPTPQQPDQWRKHKPGFEINQKGQLRTVPRH
jgi:hypothetical protein